MRRFNVNGVVVEASHAWKTNRFGRGAQRFEYIYRLCQVMSTDGESTVVRFVGLKSKPKKTVRTSEVIDLEGINTRFLPLSA